MLCTTRAGRSLLGRGRREVEGRATDPTDASLRPGHLQAAVPQVAGRRASARARAPAHCTLPVPVPARLLSRARRRAVAAHAAAQRRARRTGRGRARLPARPLLALALAPCCLQRGARGRRRAPCVRLRERQCTGSTRADGTPGTCVTPACWGQSSRNFALGALRWCAPRQQCCVRPRCDGSLPFC